LPRRIEKNGSLTGPTHASDVCQDLLDNSCNGLQDFTP
jgi:hypothetical protein